MKVKVQLGLAPNISIASKNPAIRICNEQKAFKEITMNESEKKPCSLELSWMFQSTTDWFNHNAKARDVR